MPAIKTFAEYSTLAILLNFLLQITCFVSLLSIDSRRLEDSRMDVFCCVKVKKQVESVKDDGILYGLFKNYYGPFLLKPYVRIGVILVIEKF